MNPFYTSDSLVRSLANSEDLDEMPPYVAFHQGLHYLHVEIITFYPSVYTMDHPMIIASNQKEESIRA